VATTAKLKVLSLHSHEMAISDNPEGNTFQDSLAQAA
jgi:hypothetical protein